MVINQCTLLGPFCQKTSKYVLNIVSFKIPKTVVNLSKHIYVMPGLKSPMVLYQHGYKQTHVYYFIAHRIKWLTIPVRNTNISVLTRFYKGYTFRLLMKRAFTQVPTCLF